MGKFFQPVLDQSREIENHQTQEDFLENCKKQTAYQIAFKIYERPHVSTKTLMNALVPLLKLTYKLQDV